MSSRLSEQQLAAILQSAVSLYPVADDTSSLQTRSVDTTPPAPLRPYEPIAQDGVIAAWESGRNIHLRGRAESEPGATVTLTFNGEVWHSTVNKWGYWNASMPPSVLNGLADGAYSLTLTITDKAGNSTDTQVGFGVYVDKTIKPTLTVDPISGDNAVSVTEGIYGVEVHGSATHMPANSHITVILAGKKYPGGVNDKGEWTAAIPSQDLQALQDGVYSLKVSATDPNGKTTAYLQDVTLITHVSSLPHISFDKVTADNVINKEESQNDLTFSGDLSVVVPGQQLLLCSGDAVYHAQIGSDGHWQVTIPASEVASFISLGEIRVYAQDGAGNSTDAMLELNVVTQLPDIYYEIDIGGDTTLNQQEAQHDLSFYLEGVKELTLNGKNYTPVNGMVTISAEDLQALPDGEVSALASRWDEYGNHDTQIIENLFNVATHQVPTITLNQPFGDGVLDAAELNSWHLIQGSSSHLDQGSLVTLTLGDQSYTATVKADGNWALTILAGQLAPLDDGSYQMKVSAQDKAGNVATATQPVTIDSHEAAASVSSEPLNTLLTNAGDSAAAQPSDARAMESHYNASDSSYTLGDHLQQHQVQSLA
ncbi:Ig-like domain-containing protein [Pantoea sp. B9002]|uniref:Ig-like domain-containing protein n=1 Tax=Pantoea sp. B9002 TaxID=2726979 RepID=UPI0015A200D3|nr:Ig-like domain-containing protein [Pantoea sp. B9002]NWA64134.1 Ig-like domain-containing protein [Pantoea sp. B9002]